MAPVLPCLYCESAAGDIPQAVVYEDPYVVAFLDWRQTAPGHVLVIPRKHLGADELVEGPEAEALLSAAVRLARAVRQAAGVDAVQMGAILFPGEGEFGTSGRPLRPQHIGPSETAEDGHFHLHVLPRHHGRTVARIYPYGDEVGDAKELHALAGRIREAMASPRAVL